MPYLQHPELGAALRFSRSDHTISIPRPGFDAGLGITSACSQCHADRSVAQLQRAADQWWGEVKPHPPLVAALLATGDSGVLTDSTALSLLRPDLDFSLAQIGALGALLDRYIQPDMARLPGALVERLERLAAKDDPDVSALALSALHVAAGDRRDVRRFLARTLATLGDRELLVRSRWRLVLAYLGDSYRQRGDDRTALIAYRRALEVIPDDAAVLGNMGLAYAGAGQWPEAVAAYRRSVSLDPRQPLTLVNLGLALETQGDMAGAAGAYQEALSVSPREPVALLNLGNLYFRQGNAQQAIALYRQAIAANSGLAPAHFNLGRAYALSGQLAQARAAIERGLAFEPDNSDGQAMLQELDRALGRK
jgi:tetratricopeptide (TPR) repeat protein